MSGKDSVQTAIRNKVKLIITAGSALAIPFPAFLFYNKAGIRMPRCPYPAGGVWLSFVLVPNGGYAMYNLLNALKILKEIFENRSDSSELLN
jgi:hypothetical protein